MPIETKEMKPEVLTDSVAKMMMEKMGKKYSKKVPTAALQMDFPFSVQTKEGTMTGKTGDWLAMDTQGNFYPIGAAVFAETYRPARVRSRTEKSGQPTKKD